MKTKQYLILAIATLAVLTAFSTTASAGGYGDGCPWNNFYNGTLAHGGVYFVSHGNYGGPYTGIFENVPANRTIVRFYPGIWTGSPMSGATVYFSIDINDNQKNFEYVDPNDGSAPVCNITTTPPECNVSVSGCGVSIVRYNNAAPDLVTGNNTISFLPSTDIYDFPLLVVYENESMPKIQYWIKEGHEYPDDGTNNYYIHFNETANTGPIDTTNLQSADYYIKGNPRPPHAPYLNGHSLESYHTVHKSFFSAYTNIPPEYINATTNTIVSSVSNARAMVTVFVLKYNESVTDTTPPYTAGHDPAPNATDIPPDTNIVVHVKDSGTGVDQNTIVMKVDGMEVTPARTGDKYDYLLIYDPLTDFNHEQVVNVTVDAADLNETPNVMDTDAYHFTIRAPDTLPPYTAGHDPAPGAMGVPQNTNITVHVKDDGDGVNKSMIVMTVNGSTVTPDITGDKNDYTLLYNPLSDFDSGQVVNVTVDASDLASNVMPQDSYSFTIAAGNIPPVADAGPDQTAAFGATVTFNGSGSYDPDGSIVSYGWNFGDGSTGTGEITTHAYSTDGTYTVTLTVTDNDGATGNDTAIVTVNPPGGYTDNHPLTIYDQGIINGGLVYETVTDGSTYKLLYATETCPGCGMENLTQEIKISIPEGATVKMARLYNYYCWSTSDRDEGTSPWYTYGVPAEADMWFSNASDTEKKVCVHGYADSERHLISNPIDHGNGAIQYWDTKGQSYASKSWDYPSGAFAWDVTEMVTGSGTYTAKIQNADSTPTGFRPGYSYPSPNRERFATFGFGLLVIYEDTSSPGMEYRVAEGCDMLMAREYEPPENATTSATFSGVSKADVANLTTVLTCSDLGSQTPPKNIISFNSKEIGPSTAVSDTAIGVNYFDVAAMLDENVVEFQDRDDYETVHNAFFTEIVSGVSDEMANADVPVSGTVSGSYSDTHTSNDVHESIEEDETKGNPANRYSYLEHKWTIDVTEGSDATFYVEAYRTDSGEGDSFVFEYSADDSPGSYTPMVTVTRTADDNAYQTYTFTEQISGTVYIRVRDTDRTAGNRILDTIYIDHMFIRSVSGAPGYGVTVTIDEVSKQVKPGENTTYTVTVKNTGDFEASYAVAMSGTAVDEGTIEVIPPNWNTGTLAPNVENVTTVTVSTTTSTPENTYTLIATAICDQDASVTDSATSELVVSSAENTMHVYSIAMWSTKTGQNYKIYTKVKIVDSSDVGVAGATVYLNTTLPDDTNVSSSGDTLDDGTVEFIYGPTKTLGTYTSTVTEVAKDGWEYDPGANIVTSASTTIP
jgi:hypothetical protein